MKIDKKLNIIIPIERSDDTGKAKVDAYIYALPLSLAAFNINCDLIGRAYTKIMTGGLGTIAGTRMTMNVMREIATKSNSEESFTNFQTELRRLSEYASMSPDGWKKIPLAEAIEKKLLDEDEASEVENALAFFMVASAMYKKSENRTVMLGLASILDAFPTSSNFSEFLNSLKISTATETSSKTAPSSVPH